MRTVRLRQTIHILLHATRKEFQLDPGYVKNLYQGKATQNPVEDVSTARDVGSSAMKSTRNATTALNQAYDASIPPTSFPLHRDSQLQLQGNWPAHDRLQQRL
jgi:hypothetical protein